MDELIRCPYCDDSYFSYLYHTAIALYTPIVFKNGSLIEGGIKNKCCYTYYCNNCGQVFTSDVFPMPNPDQINYC